MSFVLRFALIGITVMGLEAQAAFYALPKNESRLVLSLISEYGQPGGEHFSPEKAVSSLDQIMALMELERVNDPETFILGRGERSFVTKESQFSNSAFAQEGDTRYYWQRANDESFGLEVRTVQENGELFVTFTILRSNRLKLSQAKLQRTNADLFTGINRILNALPSWAKQGFSNQLAKSANLDLKNKTVKWTSAMPGDNRLVRLPLPRIKWMALTDPNQGSTVFDSLNDLFVFRLTHRGDCSDIFIGIDPKVN